MSWINTLRIGHRAGDDSKVTVVYGRHGKSEGFYWGCLEVNCKVIDDRDEGFGTERTETAAKIRADRHRLRHVQRGETDAVLIKHNVKEEVASGE